MIKRSTRRGIILLTLLALLSWMLGRPEKKVEQGPPRPLDTRLNYALYDFTGRLLDEQGHVELALEAPVLRNDAETGIGTIEKPTIRLRHESYDWYITAESAIISPDREHVTLAGHVLLSGVDPVSGRSTEITTADVMLDVAPRVASTGQAVSIRQPANRLDAIGMRLDMTRNRYELLHEVRAHYEID